MSRLLMVAEGVVFFGAMASILVVFSAIQLVIQ